MRQQRTSFSTGSPSRGGKRLRPVMAKPTYIEQRTPPVAESVDGQPTDWRRDGTRNSEI